jgi:hypothetical protein
MVQRSRILFYFAVGDHSHRRFLPNFVTYLFRTLGVGITLLQLYNAALFGAFWPFFAGIAFHLISAVLQFARMIVLPPETRQ